MTANVVENDTCLGMNITRFFPTSICRTHHIQKNNEIHSVIYSCSHFIEFVTFPLLVC